MSYLLRLLTFAIVLVSTPAWAEWPAESAAQGARDHPKIMQRFGGEIRNPELVAYVREIGAGMVAVSSRPDESWTFTVLDSPEVNAFALPGGYVYLTRGLLALANSESELAAVLAHEITHVVEAHVEARQAAQGDALVSGALNALVTGLFGGGEDRVGNAVRSGIETAFGQMGTYSKAQEFAADAGGIELLRRAGYRPAAQADFLGSLIADVGLKAEMADRVSDPTTVSLFANHPAPAERQLRALALANDADGEVSRARYLREIDGMIYGQSAKGGFVNGQVFTHPTLGFTFEAATGMQIENTARRIIIRGPNRSTLIMSGAPDNGDLTQALAGWAAAIPRTDRQSRSIENPRRYMINGLEAATGTLRMRKRGQRSTLRLTVIRFNGNLIRFAGNVRRGDQVSAALQQQTVNSFRASGTEGEVSQRYISLYRVQRGDSVASLAARMDFPDFQERRFRVLNGMTPEDSLTRGQQVKLVRR